MAKTFTGTTTYPDLSPDEAFARHTDEQFLRRKFEALGGRELRVEVTRDGDHVQLTIDRKVDADVPGFARKVISPSNTIHLVEQWRPDGEGYACEWTADSTPAPAKLHGTRTLTATGGGTDDTTDGNVEVKVPLIGGKLADWLAGEARKQLDEELAWMRSQS